MAARLAAAFLRGDDREKWVVASTVLAWRGLGPCVGRFAPEFELVRRASFVFTALALSAPVDPSVA